MWQINAIFIPGFKLKINNVKIQCQGVWYPYQ